MQPIYATTFFNPITNGYRLIRLWVIEALNNWQAMKLSVE